MWESNNIINKKCWVCYLGNVVVERIIVNMKNNLGEIGCKWWNLNIVCNQSKVFLLEWYNPHDPCNHYKIKFWANVGVNINCCVLVIRYTFREVFKLKCTSIFALSIQVPSDMWRMGIKLWISFFCECSNLFSFCGL